MSASKFKLEFDDARLSCHEDNATSEERFGLSVEKRRSIYKEVVIAGELAGKRADRQIPYLNDIDDAEKWNQIREKLGNENRETIAKQHRINVDQLEQVMQEAIANDWSLPAVLD